MTTHTNHLGQPIGFALPGWKPAKLPPRTPMQGRYCRVEPLGEVHGDELYSAFREDHDGRNWTYNPEGPFDSRDEFGAWLKKQSGDASRLAHAIIDGRDGRAIGIASFMRIDPAGGCIEVGSVNFTPRLQRTRMATEAMYLMMRRVFEELGYRRYEWKCDSLNEPSRNAALRYGFTYEGRFRQATTYKGRNRDTDWLSILDVEWPTLKAGYEAWLDESNFDAAGNQRVSLRAAIAEKRATA